MQKKQTNLPEVFRSDTGSYKSTAQMVKAGLARKIGPKLYTRNMIDEPEAIVSRNLWPIVAQLVPDTVVSHRTAFENQKAPDGSVFVSGPYTRRIVLPGIIIRQLVGSGPAEGDTPYMGTLHLASRARAFLENLMPSRQHDQVTKSVGREDVERRLAEQLRVHGEKALNTLRDQARSLASVLHLEEEYHVLDRLIAALLRLREVELMSPSARAYAAGEPYDPKRLPLFQALFAALRSTAWPVRPDRASEPPAFYNVAFFDAYFSNYIEGTEFPVDDAIRIVFNGEIPANRPADAHDVMGTYRLVASLDEMRQRPNDFDNFLALLMRRHATIMEGRPEHSPGQFKTRNNQAGATVFVAPELVRGTLRQGFEMYRSLDEPFARALFIMFLVTEVHPFTDGNGRIARVMLNAELIASGQTRILIPSVYRNEYVSSLKLLTNYNIPTAFLRVMERSQLFVASIDFSDLQTARAVLAACNAFHDPVEDVKLLMPVEASS